MGHAFPVKVKPFTASFENVGLSTERLKLVWTYPFGSYGSETFVCGAEVFLEDPSGATSLSGVPDEQLISSMSMAAILAGQANPRTIEFLNAVTNQNGDTKFQSIVGDVRLKPSSGSFINPAPVIDSSYGPDGHVFDFTFQKGTGSNTKVVRADIWAASRYDQRTLTNLGVILGDPAHSVYVVPGAIYRQFPTLKKSNLGDSDSQARQDVIAYVATLEVFV